MRRFDPFWFRQMNEENRDLLENKEIEKEKSKYHEIDTSHPDLTSPYPPNGYGDGSIC